MCRFPGMQRRQSLTLECTHMSEPCHAPGDRMVDLVWLTPLPVSGSPSSLVSRGPAPGDAFKASEDVQRVCGGYIHALRTARPTDAVAVPDTSRTDDT